jgi:hypothetical protein
MMLFDTCSFTELKYSFTKLKMVLSNCIRKILCGTPYGKILGPPLLSYYQSVKFITSLNLVLIDRWLV